MIRQRRTWRPPRALPWIPHQVRHDPPEADLAAYPTPDWRIRFGLPDPGWIARGAQVYLPTLSGYSPGRYYPGADLSLKTFRQSLTGMTAEAEWPRAVLLLWWKRKRPTA